MTYAESRVLIGLIFGALFAIIQWVREERNRQFPEDRKLNPIVSPATVLGTCLGLLLCSLVLSWLPAAAGLLLTAEVFLQAGVYYTLLLILHPLLRRTVSGRGRSVLWVLPNVRYACIQIARDAPPRWVITMDSGWLIVLLIVWLCGAVFVLLCETLRHGRFRREILKNIHEPPEEALAILREEEKKLWPQQEYTLVISPDAKTPLSIGLTKKSLRIVLPERSYSEEELSLILRHELVHIKRGDNTAKLFLAVCTALSWFNPFVWLSRRCACEDFESGCDELVLSDADEGTRRRYAELILDSAADARGFTTCLSADAASLRNRLRDVVKPRKKLVGCALTGLLVFLLFFTGNRIGVAYDAQSGGELLFRGASAAEVSYTELRYTDRNGIYDAPGGCREDLTAYLSGLTLYKIAADYVDYGSGETRLFVICTVSGDDIWFTVFDRGLTVHGDRTHDARSYYLAEDVDWDELLRLLFTDA